MIFETSTFQCMNPRARKEDQLRRYPVHLTRYHATDDPVLSATMITKPSYQGRAQERNPMYQPFSVRIQRARKTKAEPSRHPSYVVCITEETRQARGAHECRNH